MQLIPGPDRVLKDHIRRRPGMYVGGLNDRGMRHVLGSAIEEQIALTAKQLKRVEVIVLGPQSANIRFIGGPAVDVPAMFAASWTNPHALSDIAVTAALARLRIEDNREGKRIAYECEPSHEHVRAMSLEPVEGESLSMTIHFDRTLFPSTAALEPLALCGRLQELAAFHPSTVFALTDQQGGWVREYVYPNGLISWIAELDFEIFDRCRLSSNWRDAQLFHVLSSIGGESVEVVIHRPVTGRSSLIKHTFVNGRRTVDEGSHWIGFKKGFDLSLVAAGIEPPRASGFDWLDGATVLVAVSLIEPEWAGSTKDELRSERVEKMVMEAVLSQLPQQLQQLAPSLRDV